MSKYFVILLIGFAIPRCKTSNETLSKTYKNNIPIVQFCDLPNYKGKQVYLKCLYSGIDEYWSLKDIARRKCKPALSIDLQFVGYNPFLPPEKYRKVFTEVGNNYHNSYLLLEAIGIFEKDSSNRYGHLGSNNSRFIVSELISATLHAK